MKMTFFGKLKNLNAGPPAPPRRPGNSGFDWPQDEFTDDEEGDMYEAPPCERPAVKVPQTQVQDNIYLERTTNPGIPKREAAPLPPQAPKNMKRQQRQDLINDMKKPPEVDRNDKPGRKKMMPPPPPPVSESNEEDVYLDPNQEPEENDDLYLEPEAACSPGPRAPMRKPPSPSTAAVPMPIRAKPPIPGGKSSSMFPPVIDRKTGQESSSVLTQNVSQPAKYKHPTCRTEFATLTPGVSYLLKPQGGMRVNKPLRDEDKEWFAGDCTRKTAEDFLERVNKDGAFLIRHSSDQRTSQPFTLAVLYQQKVYNIPIRFLEDVQGYALGKEGKTNEETFSSLDEMISHHKKNKLLLIDSKSQAKHSVHLTYPGRP
ncbi:B-cell linker protein [Oryzias melastigma]|uniref:B-cell linker protein n=1 Tax=Oryzias melastigma TaxID=30732 RepID=A0A834F9H1_ORYME|nr:B-cell linker protein isoform X1 [Oryzias melastigma]KAF6730055.1 B-cell linker protein [Oryzias melastigma]